MSVISLEATSKSYNGVVALRSTSFDVAEGTLVVLLGPSGCGKSTTLRLIAGLEAPTTGRIRILGRDVTDLSPSERGIAMVFQSYALFPHLSVAENIIFGLKVRNVGRGERTARLTRVAEIVGLKDQLARRPSQLSGGQRQRVALARALIAEQPVCLMDEPLSNLDAQLRHEMRVEIRALQQRLGITMIYVTHDQTEAMTMGDQVILMRDGQIEQMGSPEALYRQPETSFAARFIGAPPMNLIAAGEAMIGIRAEAMRLVGEAAGGKHGRAGEISSVEYLGSDSIVTVTLPTGEKLAVRHPGLAQIRVGSQAGVTWAPQDEIHFDARSGRRLPPQPIPLHPHRNATTGF
jgi:sn-glycerol 3-phosphate transport system ATP-binding protein